MAKQWAASSETASYVVTEGPGSLVTFTDVCERRYARHFTIFHTEWESVLAGKHPHFAISSASENNA